ncbi:MAG: SPOR domain-containing protein [Oceanihabitans sp.]
MNIIKITLRTISIVLLLLFSGNNYAQEATLTINQDPEIKQLLEHKKAINKDDNSNKNYKIQLFSGRRAAAEKHLLDFRHAFGDWSGKLEYETPNYKVWVGNFKSHLEADRALLKIKKKFPNAFRFKPKKKDR